MVAAWRPCGGNHGTETPRSERSDERAERGRPTLRRMSIPRTALIAGASGLVGRTLVQYLATNPAWSAVHALIRQGGTSFGDASTLQTHTVDYDALVTGTIDLPVATHAFCCLGTTRRKAGSDAAFRRVDFDYCLAFARAARRAGAQHLLLVSAVGASSDSPLLYSRTKGEVEGAVTALGFRATTIVRPSFLDGDRAESRPMERLGIELGRFLPAAWRSVPVGAVTSALVHAAMHDRPGAQVLENAALLQMNDMT